MVTRRLLAIGVLAAASAAIPALAQTSIETDQAAAADYARRVQAYVELKDRAAQTAPPLRTVADPGEIRRTSDALAAAIQSARSGARQGDIFSPEIAQMIRRAVRSGCDQDYAQLLALIDEELEAPLPPPVVHGRWPIGAPLPTMMPDMLAALPRLPPGLEYRFIRHDLVLRDIDANLIVDFVRDAIPTTVPTDGSLLIR